ncbi:hypothetical protein [Bacillus sp. NPDC094106]|uniref:hypothetical protein n=1 Tax=Bacillus sp. NPDC094106 TaxID=3363949 RepID=UPI0037FE64EE
MNIEEKKVAKKKLEEELMEIEKQVQELDLKKRRLSSKINDYQKEIERDIYHGMTQNEYFSNIHGTEFDEGKFHIRIGGVWGNGLYVLTNVGDMELSVHSRYNEKGGSLSVSKDSRITGRGYDKEYEVGEIPDKYKEVYKEMLIIKTKYGKMMENGEIKRK